LGGAKEELEKCAEQLAVRSEMRDITVALSANTRKTTVGGELELEGNVAKARAPPGLDVFVGEPYYTRGGCFS
jgi:hypothetical protein